MKKAKKIFILLVVLVLPFMTNVSMVNAKILDYGDVNEDGSIDNRDAALAQQIYLETETPTPIQKVLADVNFDCGVDNIDSSLIMQYYLNGNWNVDPLKDKILGSSNANVKTGSYEPRYDSTCVAGYGQVDKCITGYEFSNSESGLYSGTDSDGTTYYYRGDVTNNYVQFADQVWRIVRINGDGTIRLMTNDAIGKSKYDDNSLATSYQASTLNTVLNTWYNINIGNNSNYNNKVATGKFCNDTDLTDQEFLNLNSLKCNGNVITSKIGTISGEELKFGGLNLNFASSTTYLNKDSVYLTMTLQTDPYEILVYDSNIVQYLDDTTRDVYGVINLLSDVKITSGDGSESSPYVIGDTTDLSNKAIIMNTINAATENKINKIDLNYGGIYSTYNTSSDNGEWLYNWNLWELSEQDEINTDEANSIDTRIEIKDNVTTSDSQEYNQMKYALQKINKDSNTTYIKLEQTGDLPRNVNIEINKTLYNIKGKYLYYWDTANKRFVSKGQATETAGSLNGCSTGYTMVTLNNIDKGGYYILTAEDLDSLITNPQTGMTTFYIIGATIILVGLGTGYLIYAKKTNKFPKI